MATLVQVVFTSKTGLPEDQWVNTFHFLKDEMTDPEAAACVLALEGFYSLTDPAGQIAALGSYMSNVIDRTIPVDCRFFNTTVSGEPAYHSEGFNLAASSGSNPLPAEVAACLSYRQYGATGLQARRQRGRIYLGPLNAGAVELSADSAKVELSAAFTNDLIEAGRGLFLNSTAETWGPWVVHSTYGSDIVPGSNPPRLVQPPTLQTDYPIDWLHVDGAPDTQRRRGEGAGYRRTYDLR